MPVDCVHWVSWPADHALPAPIKRSLQQTRDQFAALRDQFAALPSLQHCPVSAAQERTQMAFFAFSALVIGDKDPPPPPFTQRPPLSSVPTHTTAQFCGRIAMARTCSLNSRLNGSSNHSAPASFSAIATWWHAQIPAVF